MPRPTDRHATPCVYCRAPRVNGIRTCGTLCLRGVDPRLADYLGVLPWVASGGTPQLGT